MNTVVFLRVVFTISLTIHVINGVTVTGPETNISSITWKALKKNKELQLEHFLTKIRSSNNERGRVLGGDAAITRNFIKEIISAIRKQFNQNKPQDDGNSEFVSNDFIDYDEDPAFVNRVIIGDSVFLDRGSDEETKKIFKPNVSEEDLVDLRTIIRNSEKKRRKKKVDDAPDTTLADERHTKRVYEITEFIQARRDVALYIHSEILRIKKDGKIRDTLRIMVEYLAKPGMDPLKKSVLKCFYDKVNILKPKSDMWKDRIPNNLVIQTIKDPYNY